MILKYSKFLKFEILDFLEFLGNLEIQEIITFGNLAIEHFNILAFFHFVISSIW